MINLFIFFSHTPVNIPCNHAYETAAIIQHEYLQVFEILTTIHNKVFHKFQAKLKRTIVISYDTVTGDQIHYHYVITLLFLCMSYNT